MKLHACLIIAVLVLAGGPARAQSDAFSLRDAPVTAVESASATGQQQNQENLARWQQGPGSAAQTRGDVSMRRAILYSLLLPGMGEYYAGRTLRAKAFFAAEAGIWTAFTVLRVQGHVRENRYKKFAVEFAGITTTDHTDDFYKTIGQYDSSSDYEAEFKAEGRVDIWPDVGYDALERYYVENRISDFEEWAWSSFDRRVDFREMRSSSRLAYRRSLYMVAAAAANRIASAVSTYQIFKSGRGETVSRTGRYFLDFGPPDHDTRGEYAGAVTLIRTF